MAAAAYGEGDGPPPRELRWLSRIRKWGDPYGGGWMDWPAGLIDRMTQAEAVYTAFHGFYNASNAVKWSEGNPELWDIVTQVLTLRKEHDR